MRKRPMPVGSRYGRLVVEGDAPNVGRRCAYRCVCDCGVSVVVSGNNLVSGNSQSCGCMQREQTGTRFRKHGASKRTAEHKIWEGMKQRCLNPSNPDWTRYGGRGITICDRWRHDFTAFLSDVGPRPSPLHTIDRRDNDRGYEPGNVRWATPVEQNRNSTSAKLEPHEPEQIKWLASLGYTNAEIGRHFGISESHAGRVRRGEAWG